MLNFKKLMSFFLAFLMLCSALTSLSVVTAFAEEAAATETTTGTANLEEEDEEARTLRYHSTVFANPEEKVATMKKMSEKGNYILYADQASGEVAIRDKATNQILFTNPYDIGTSNATENVKNRLMSQIIVNFKEVESDGSKSYESFTYAAAKDQIKVKNIKNGIRVEYTIGREEARRLVPRQIEKSRFEELIQAPMEEYYGITREEADAIATDYDHPHFSIGFYLRKQLSYFIYHDLDLCESDRLKQDKLNAFPILSKMDIYALEPTASTNEIEKLEEVIKSACPNYSYEEMDYDHQLTEFTSEEENPPLFKMALEYTIDEHGVSVRLPANGIRFNESKFELINLDVLPYLGAGNNNYDGYAFFPDGSGTLFSFEDMRERNAATITSKIYGEDYAYHKLSNKYQQVVRYPVYGLVEETVYYDFTVVDSNDEEKIVTISGVIYDELQKAIEDGTTGSNALYKTYGHLVQNAKEGDVVKRVEKRGHAVIMEEGDALTSLSYKHDGTQSEYDTISMQCNPRPRDEYNLADAISVGNNEKVSVVSERKYVGNYKVRIAMLADKDIAAKAVAEGTLKSDGWYEASWLGMAIAYRDYLVRQGYLSSDSVSSNQDIPLYIESFGAMETIEKVLSIPVEVMRPLTSTDNVLTMYKELAAEGVSNINFKLTGYANGGMYATIPYGLKWEKAVNEKDVTMQDLFNEAANITASGEGSLSLFPDFDFSYVSTLEVFDGFSMRKHAVRTIDDRYSFKREYMATQQKYAGYFYLAVSPAYFNRFYTKFMEKYTTYDNITGISVGTLGNALNSDFDEDEPYNREDAKSFVAKALEFISGGKEGNMEVMVDGGNAFTWQYVDHVLGASLDSSRYNVSSYSVPFLGVVLHGYMNFAGSPLNMEGDLNYAKLKAIENGASVYFTLSYQNTQNLKEDFYLSKYYSVRYDIWFDDVVEIYNELNAQLKDVQSMPIIGHEFLSGMRVPDTDELDRDLKDEYDAAMKLQGDLLSRLDQMKAESVADARRLITKLAENIKSKINSAISKFNGNSGATVLLLNGNKSFVVELQEYTEATKLLEEVTALNKAGQATDERLQEVVTAHTKAKNALDKSVNNITTALIGVRVFTDEIEELMAEADEALALIEKIDAGKHPALVQEVKEAIAAAEEIRNQLMGVTFEYSTGNLEVNTFLYLHYATLLFNARGEINHTGSELVGAVENIYKVFADDQYGLCYDEIWMLRYLEANRNLTDDQIAEKYGLSKNAPSVDGLVQYTLELLGDGYEFDPAYGDDVDVCISTFFKNKFMYNSKEDYKDLNKTNEVTAFLQFFNVDPYRPHPTRPNATTINNMNILAILKLVQGEMDVLVNKKTGLVSKITDGIYDLDAIMAKNDANLFTQKDLDTLVAKIEQIFADNDRDNKNAKNPIKYLGTADELKADILNYIKSYYYFKVMDMIIPEDAKDAVLPILTVESKTDTSIDRLLNYRLENIKPLTDAGRYAQFAEFYMADKANVAAVLQLISDKIKPYYGKDLTTELQNAYLLAFCEVALTKTTPTLSLADSKEQTEIRKLAKELMETELKNIVNFDGIDAVIAKVENLHAGKELKDGYNVTDASAAYVYYNYFDYLSDNLVAGNAYYYDRYLATVDAAVIEKVAAQKQEILNKIGEDHTYFQFIEAVFAILGDKENPAEDFTDALADSIIYTPSKKGNLADDVFQHYAYSLFNCTGESLGTLKSMPLTIKDSNLLDTVRGQIKDYISKKYMNNLLKAAKNAGNGYALTAFLSEAELSAIVDDIIQVQLVKLNHVASVTDELRAQVTDILKFCFYENALKQLNAQKPVDFNVDEVYGSSLETSADDIKKILQFYLTTNGSASADQPIMTEKEFNDLFAGGGDNKNDDDEDTFSRYLSDDGRIVSVTYGQKQADGTYAKYKTFVLNYNSFSVNVEYENVTYTIPAYGYVVVMHTNP